MDSFAETGLSREEVQARICARSNNPERFAGYNGIRVTRADETGSEGVLEVGPHSLNVHGFVHGGCLATLADTVAGAGAAANGYSTVSLSGNVNYLRPGTGERLFCRAVPERIGKTICVMYVEITDEENRKVLTGSFTFYVLGPLGKI